ncbi:MAG: leucyl aminopeptidase, partial [Alphaproteobacteria bacterium]|nr:leucyl aminopeptidase [Alphaproteobacteria bacterium]
MKITFDTKSAKADALVVFAAQGGTLLKEGVALDKKEKGLIKRAIKAEKFKGDAGTSIVVTGGNAPYIVVLGLGKTKSADTLVFEKLGDTLARLLCARKATSANVLCEGLELPKTLPPEKAVTAMAEFALLADYRFDKYKTKAPKDKKPALKSISFSLKAAARAKELFAAREKVAAGAFLTRDLVTEVPNVLYPETFASIIKKEMKPLGVTVKVLTETDMKLRAMGAL